MDPVLVQLGPVAIRWYGVMLATTIVLSLLVAYRIGPRLGVPAAVLDRTATAAVLVMFVGARLGYVVSHPSQFLPALWEIVRIDRGGLSSHGAIAAGLLYAAWAARRTGVSLWQFADTFGWAIPIGNIFVRFGNFMNGELYGDPTGLPWGVVFPTMPDAPRHPLQIYEMLLAVVVLLRARTVAARPRFPGEVFWSIVVPTSVGRLVFDALRSEMRALGPLTLGQLPALVLIGWGLWDLRRQRR
ncbi:MAG: prolipoprotein diacylglyceryl transferase [Armatimonadota bacterium]|nr:prolipoprotein diacylglyceryl transferase [Armatimonadota bacterium]MDR7533193.1 prolipoprotein diacylglyceryl transferase [Armatimonadota bacterium]MDR7535419.1 prolipoprotein diacylglyceryl transferase [Armatimonadota bacterium]